MINPKIVFLLCDVNYSCSDINSVVLLSDVVKQLHEIEKQL
jgi:hypothetical protein